MSGAKYHSQETGHLFVLTNQADEWEGFCFDCTLEYIFSVDSATSFEQRVEVIELVRSCIITVGKENLVERLAVAAYWYADKALTSHRSFHPSLFLRLVERMEDRIKIHCIDIAHDELAAFCLGNALKYLAGDPRRVAVKNWAACMWCKAARKYLALVSERTKDRIVAAELTDKFGNAATFYCRTFSFLQQASKSDESAVLLKLEAIVLLSTTLNAEPESSPGGRIDSLLEQPTNLQIGEMLKFATREVGADNSAALSALQLSAGGPLDVATPSMYHAGLFALIAAVALTPGCGESVAEAVLGQAVAMGRNWEEPLLLRLVRAAMRQYEEQSTCADRAPNTEQNHRNAGLLCIAAMLQAVTSVTQLLSALAQRLLADDCHYSSLLFGIWDCAKSAGGLPYQWHVSILSQSVVHTYYLLAVGCPSGFFHYASFTAKMGTELLHHYFFRVKQLMQQRRLPVTSVASTSAHDMAVDQLQYLLQQALLLGACSDSTRTAIATQCAAELDTADAERRTGGRLQSLASRATATICAASHVIPLLLGLLGSDCTERQRSALRRAVLQALCVLAQALVQATSADYQPVRALQERTNAVVGCVDCLVAVKSTILKQADQAQRNAVVHECAVLVSMACDVLGTEGEQPLLLDRLFTALISLMVDPTALASPASDAVLVLDALYSTGHNCRSLHRALAGYLSIRCSGAYSCSVSSEQHKLVEAFSTFITACCDCCTRTESGQAKEVNTARVHEAIVKVLKVTTSNLPESLLCNSNDTLTGICIWYLSLCLPEPSSALLTQEALRQIAETHSTPPDCLAAGMGALLLSLMNDPVRMCEASPVVVLQLLQGCSMQGLVLAPTASAVCFTYSLILQQQGGAASPPLLGDDFSSGLQVPAEELWAYWGSCLGADEQFMGNMFVALLDCCIMSSGETRNPQCSALLLQSVVRILPCTRFCGLLPNLLRASQCLSTGSEPADSCVGAVWSAIVEALLKERLEAGRDSIDPADSSGAKTALFSFDTTLQLLQRAEVFAQHGISDPQSAQGALRVSVQRAAVALCTAAVAAYVRCLPHQGCSGLTQLEAVSEFVRRSGWKDQTTSYLKQLPIHTEVHRVDQLLSFALHHALALLPDGYNNVICGVVLNQLQEDQQGADGWMQLMSASNAEPDDTGSAIQKAVRHSASCLLATLMCCDFDAVTSGGGGSAEEPGGMTTSALLRCWLLRSQEVLLLTSRPPHQSQSLTVEGELNLVVAAQRELRRSAVLFCTAHLHLRERGVATSAFAQYPQQQQAWHIMWLAADGSTYELQEDAAFASKCAAVLLRARSSAEAVVPQTSKAAHHHLSPSLAEVKELVLDSVLRLHDVWVALQGVGWVSD